MPPTITSLLVTNVVASLAPVALLALVLALIEVQARAYRAPRVEWTRAYAASFRAYVDRIVAQPDPAPGGVPITLPSLENTSALPLRSPVPPVDGFGVGSEKISCSCDGVAGTNPPDKSTCGTELLAGWAEAGES